MRDMASSKHGPNEAIGVPDLRLVIDSTPALIHTGLPDGYLDFFNQPWLKYVGRSLEDLEGWKWTASIHPEDVEGIVDRWQASLASGEQFLYEARVRRADGEYRWMLHHKVPLRDKEGKIVKWYGSSIDIEERKRAEEKVRQSEAELRQLIDVIPQQIFVIGTDGVALFANRQDQEYTGLSLEELQGKDAVARIFHPDDVGTFERVRERVLSQGTAFEIEARVRGKSGQYRWFLIRVNPLHDERGSVVRWYGTRTEIEDRKRAEDDLRRSEALLAEAQRLSSTGSFGWNVASGEILWSKESFRIFQYDPATRPTMEVVFQRVHPEDKARVRETIERAAQDRNDFDCEHRLLSPDGSVKYVHVVAHALSDKSGNLEFVGAVMDVTAARETEDRIRLIINTVPGLLWTARPDGWIDFISKRWLDFTGMAMEQGLGWGWEPAYHPDDHEELLRTWRAALAEAKPFEAETRLRRFDGEYRWFLSRAFPLLDRAGSVLGWYGSDIDIHDRKQAEEKIQKQELELRQILDVAPQHVGVLNPDGSHLYLNKAALDYYGLTLEEWRNCDPQRLVHPDDWERMVSEAQAKFSSGTPHEIEERLLRHDGEYRWFLARLTPLKDEQGRVMRWYAAVTDIEERLWEPREP
jgi:PAS domain S-box-containing protein